MRAKTVLIPLIILGLWMAGCAGASRSQSNGRPTPTSVFTPVLEAVVSPVVSPAAHPTDAVRTATVQPTSAVTRAVPTVHGAAPTQAMPDDALPAGPSPTQAPTTRPPPPSPSSTQATPADSPPASPSPTGTPTLPATLVVPSTAVAPTTLRTTQVTIPTYPYAQFVRQAVDPTLGDYPVMVLDRAAYDASIPRPAPRTYKLLVLENAYLRLSVLPELGGRLYEMVFKPTGNDELYRNPVIKPTVWGPPSPPYPVGANWWLAAGGIEWCFPVEEHGYEWATSWGYDQVPTGDGGIMLTLFTRDSRRPYAVVDIILPPDKAYIVVRPRITNVWGSEFRFQWWTNAMLAPGAANEPGPDLRFILPGSEMTVHSTGDTTLPAAGQPLSWPVYQDRDLSRLGNWTQWLGFFQRPAAAGDFSGVYDVGADEGMIRIFPSGVARGSKGFAPGWSAPIDSKTWTDDGSGYVELQGGLTPTFGERYVLPPGGEITWEETWYPVAGIGGVTHATRDGAIHLAPSGGGLRVALFPTASVTGRVIVTLPGMAPIVREVNIGPAAPFSEVIPVSEAVPAEGEVSLALTDAQGQAVLTYRGTLRLR